MLDKNSLAHKVMSSGILARVPHDSAANAMKLVSGLLKGGVGIIEVDIRSSKGMRIVEKCASRFAGRLITSADFVLDPHSAREAILAGADVISTPYLLKDVIKRQGAEVYIYDPLYTDKELVDRGLKPMKLSDRGKLDALILVTAHKEFFKLDWRALKGRGVKVFVDGRNCFESEKIEKAGIKYIGIGKGHKGHV